MSQPQRAIPQSKEALLTSYTKRSKDDLKSMLENFIQILTLARVSTGFGYGFCTILEDLGTALLTNLYKYKT